MACFLLYFTGRRGHPMWHRANVAMTLICRKSEERQARKKFYNKCSENSRSQIVFLTDIFRKLTLGALEYYPDLFSMKPKARSSKVRKFIIIIIIIIIIFLFIIIFLLLLATQAVYIYWGSDVSVVISTRYGFCDSFFTKSFFLVVSPFACLITTHEHVYRSWPALIYTSHGALKNKKMEKLLFYDF